jgi:hypothetical protein
MKKRHWNHDGGGTPNPPPNPPSITSPSSGSIQENLTLSHALTANESVTWGIVGGADSGDYQITGSTLQWLGNTTRDFENPVDADTNNTYIVVVRATSVATALTTDQTITYTVLDVAEGGGGTTLAPSAAWNGVADSGFVAPHELVPAATDDALEHPSLHLLMQHYVTITGQHAIAFTSNCSTANRRADLGEDFTSGVASVDVYWEGTKATLTTKSWLTYVDANGTVSQVWGYVCYLDCDAACAVTNTGVSRLYAVSHPTDGAKFDCRMGPYVFHPRPSVVALADHTLHIDFEAASDTVGSIYRKVSTALSYIASQSWKNTVVIVDKSFTEIWTTPAISRSGTIDNCTTIRAASGVTWQVKGTGSGTILLAHNGIRFLGSGIWIDYSEGNLQGSASNGIVIFDGCTIGPSKWNFQNQLNGDPSYWLANATGPPQYHAFFDAIFPYGGSIANKATICRNVYGNVINNDALDNVLCIHGAWINRIDPTLVRQHSGNEAMLVTSPTGYKMEVTGDPRLTSRTVNIYDASDVLQSSFAINNTVGGGHYTWADLAVWLNGTFSTNVVATVLPPSAPGRGSDRRVSYISNTTIGPNNIPTTTFTKITIPTSGSGGLTCTAIVDAHVDAIQNRVSTGMNNLDYGFLDFFDQKQVQQIFLEAFTGGMKNCFMHHINIRPDVDPANAGPIVWGGAYANSGMEYATVHDSLYQFAVTGGGFNPTSSFWVHHCYMGGSFTWTGTADADARLDCNYGRTGLATNSVNSVDGASAAESTLFQNTTVRQTLPITSGPLLNSTSGKYMGAFRPDGSWNGT